MLPSIDYRLIAFRCRAGARRGNFQKASAGNSIIESAPVWMRERRKEVSGSMRSMKNLPVTSLDFRFGRAPAVVNSPCATVANYAHIEPIVATPKRNGECLNEPP